MDWTETKVSQVTDCKEYSYMLEIILPTEESSLHKLKPFLISFKKHLKSVPVEKVWMVKFFNSKESIA
jgi:hypothetical protein